MVDPPQQGLILFKLQTGKSRNNVMARVLKKTSLRSFAITEIRKATTPGIVPSQKTSYSLGNFYVGD